MSYYSEFNDDVFHVLKELKLKVLGIPYDQISETLDIAYRVVIPKWIKEKKYEGLVSWAIENFDTTGGDEFISIISEALVKSKNLRLLRKLWKGIISNRKEHYRALKGYPVQFARDGEKDKQCVISAMETYTKSLEKLGELEEAKLVNEDISLFLQGKKRKKKIEFDNREMTEEVFWSIIDETRKDTVSSSEHMERLRESLEKFKPKQIKNFQKIFYKKINEIYSWDSWALAYIVRNGCSDDAFDYFLGWIISKGQKTYEKLLKSPETLIDIMSVEDPQCESIYYVADEAYENVSDKPMIVNPSKGKIKGKEWKEEDLPKLYPKLCKYFKHSK